MKHLMAMSSVMNLSGCRPRHLHPPFSSCRPSMIKCAPGTASTTRAPSSRSALMLTSALLMTSAALLLRCTSCALTFSCVVQTGNVACRQKLKEQAHH